MHITKTVCQLRRDLREDIPESVLQLDRVREAIARVVGKERPQESDEETKRLIEIVARDESERASALRRKLAARIMVQHGFFDCVDAGRTGKGFIVEDLTVSRDSLYARSIGTTEDCRRVIEKTVTVLCEYGVPEATFEAYDEAFATLTVARLDGPIEGLFTGPFRQLLHQDLAAAAQKDEETRVVIHPYEVNAKVHFWQRDAQRPEKAKPDRWDFHIMHSTFDDHDKQIYTVTTEFDYAKHVRILELLEQCVKPTAGETDDA